MKNHKFYFVILLAVITETRQRFLIWDDIRTRLSHGAPSEFIVQNTDKMNKYFFFSMLLISLSMAGQAVPKKTPMPAKVYTREPIVIIDPARENPVLVIHGNRRIFVKDKKTVTDTLPKNTKYQVLTNNDSIKRYSNSKFVRQVLLID
jgi:hypothetical protein